jgi:hypothetical protein
VKYYIYANFRIEQIWSPFQTEIYILITFFKVIILPSKMQLLKTPFLTDTHQAILKDGNTMFPFSRNRGGFSSSHEPRVSSTQTIFENPNFLYHNSKTQACFRQR